VITTTEYYPSPVYVSVYDTTPVYYPSPYAVTETSYVPSIVYSETPVYYPSLTPYYVSVTEYVTVTSTEYATTPVYYPTPSGVSTTEVSKNHRITPYSEAYFILIASSPAVLPIPSLRLCNNTGVLSHSFVCYDHAVCAYDDYGVAHGDAYGDEVLWYNEISRRDGYAYGYGVFDVHKNTGTNSYGYSNFSESFPLIHHMGVVLTLPMFSQPIKARDVRECRESAV
jgi:hypothetical protein